MSDWARHFYHRQNELAGVYTGDIQGHHQDRVKLIQEYHHQAKTVLELGAGGGQIACATALAGYETTAIEIVESLASHMRALAHQHNVKNLTIVNDDFYNVTFDKTFDVITYWDGFGIGSDEEQIQLLRRCKTWLTPNGILLLDVYTPWYWANAAGQMMNFGNVKRKYNFDALENRMLDTWWHTASPDITVTQSLRCYAPVDLKLLLRDTGLVLDEVIQTGGAILPDKTYQAHVNLQRAMSYTIRITHNE